MGNVKISAFSSQPDLSQIDGLAGYEGTVGNYTNARISGTQIQTWLQNNLTFATATGTSNYVAKFTGANSLGDSNIQDDGTYVGFFSAPITNVGVYLKYTETQAGNIAFRIDSEGEYGINSKAFNNGTATAVDKIGVYAQALDSSDKNIAIEGFANGINGGSGGNIYAIGGKFKADNADYQYALQLQDDTESAGKFLKCVDANGYANWATVPQGVASISIGTAAISTGDLLTVNTVSEVATITPHYYAGEANVGYVPTGGDNTKFLRGDGTWVVPTDTTYTAGDGLELTGTTFSTDLKANGGLVIESQELALDLGAASITGTLASGDGGTGFSTYTKGDLLYSSATNVLSKLPLGTAGHVLKVNTTGVPYWAAETGYTLPLASSTVRGGIKIGFPESGKDYPVELLNEQAFVNVPWTDTNDNTTYGISITQETAGSNDSPNFTLTPSTGSADNIQFAGELPAIVTRSTDDIVIFSSRPFAGSSTTGHVPSSASANQTTTFLRADGSWVAPSGSGSVTTVGVTNNINGFSIAVTNATTTPNIEFSVVGATSGQYLDYQGNWNDLPSTSAAGSASQIQYNDGSNGFAANAGLTYSTGSSLNTLVVGQQGSVPGVVEIKGADTTKGRLRLYCPDNTTPHYFELIGPAHGSASTYGIEVPNTGPGATEKILSVKTWTSGTGLAELEWVDLPTSGLSSWIVDVDTGGDQTINAAGNTLEIFGGTGISTGVGVTTEKNVTISLDNTTVSAGTYGDASNVAQITVDAQGRITSASSVAISASGGGFPSAVTSTVASPLVAGSIYLLTSSGASVATLPAGSSGDVIGVKWVAQGATTDSLVVKTQTGKKIDGVVRDTNGLPLASLNNYYEFVCDGTDWYIK